ncbi:MAG: hypothetical protein P4L87_10345 [Formivibrio sp.]|nr:hypothetical protein [Formivibrio sp.]
MSQICTICRIDKPEEDFYRVDAVKIFRRCKACISAAKPKKPRLTGWQMLPKETQDEIRVALQNRNMKIKQIAEKFGLNYANFTYWIRNKHI